MVEFTINPIVLGFLFAGGAHAAVMLWLLGHPARNDMKTTLCWWEGIGLLWHICMGIRVIYDINPEMDVFFGLDKSMWYKAAFFFSVLTSLSVVTFIYAILQRKRGKMYTAWWLYLSAQCLYVMISPTAWSSAETEELLGALGPLLCYFYCIGLMLYTYTQSRDRPLRMRIICTILGLGGAVFLYTVFGKVLPQIMQFDGSQVEAQILIFNGAWISTFVMIAAVRYGIVRMELDEIAEDIFTNMTDPVLLVGPGGQIMRVNPPAVARFPTAFSAETLPLLSELIPAHDISGNSFETSSIEAAKGCTFSCNMSQVQRGEDNLGSILILRDTTHEKEVDRMKTELTSTVSHELRTPLTSVLGFAKLIQKRFDTMILPHFVPENKKQARALQQITQNISVIISEGTRLTNLINDVLDISKMEAGKLDWNVTQNELSVVIEQAVAASSGLFARRPEVTLVEEHLSPLPTLAVDADRIIQVLLNLISNAVKFTDAGTVTIRTKVTDTAFEVAVIDQGIGIAAADCAKVFEKYKQVGERQGNRPKGTGLGLPISKEIIEFHNGRIWVESEIGQGSSFLFALPLAAQQED